MNKADRQGLYTAALSETDPRKICMRIRQAETAINLRFQNVAEDSDLSDERDMITDALSSLRAVERTYARYR
jgi:hypothetical protein